MRNCPSATQVALALVLTSGCEAVWGIEDTVEATPAPGNGPVIHSGGSAGSRSGEDEEGAEVPPSRCSVPQDCRGAWGDWVCDPHTAACSIPECTPDPVDGTCGAGCNEGRCCVAQTLGGPGVCYDSCSPFSDEAGCLEGLTCVMTGYAGSAGLCLRLGRGEVGDGCDPPAPIAGVPISSGCDVGARCDVARRPGPICTEQCDFFDPSPHCRQEGYTCSLSGICVAEQTVHEVGLGEACPGDLTEGLAYCAPKGAGAAGVCSVFLGKYRCLQVCSLQGDSDCIIAGARCEAAQLLPLDTRLALCVP